MADSDAWGKAWDCINALACLYSHAGVVMSVFEEIVVGIFADADDFEPEIPSRQAANDKWEGEDEDDNVKVEIYTLPRYYSTCIMLWKLFFFLFFFLIQCCLYFMTKAELYLSASFDMSNYNGVSSLIQVSCSGVLYSWLLHDTK